MKKILIVTTIIVVGGIIWLAVSQSEDDKTSASSENLTLQGEEIPILDRDHVSEGTKVTDYNSNPPTSGKHWPAPAGWGTYNKPLPDEVLVHNLEHGGIWISYKDIEDNALSQLEDIANRYDQAVILTPRPQNDTPIALASWGRLEKLDTLNMDRVEIFIKANINNSPEPLASLEKAKIVRGQSVPEAHFTLLDGEDAHLSDFRGQKVMFWVFATWCPSCIAGAQVLSKNNDQLGNLTILAIKTYGNAGYSGPSVKEFAEKNAPEMLAASNWLWGDASEEATGTYNPRNYPDIYFLIDENGVLIDIDGAPAATINKIIEFANE